MKVCSRCLIEKDADKFTRPRGRGGDGINAWCLTCNAEYNRQRYAERKAEDPVALARYGRNSTLKSRYGITIEEFEAKIQAQNGFCAICHQHPATEMDHCHETGILRDVLCTGCNTGVRVREWHQRMLDYIDRHAKNHAGGS